jgi:hypothetical protein
MTDTRSAAAPRRESSSVAEPTAWVGWVVFAATMLVMLGTFHAIQGLVALFQDDYYLVGAEGLVVSLDFTTWGWTHLILGVLAVVTGIALLSGATWARALAVVVAFLSAIANVGFLAAYPVWSTLMIALNVVIIYAITVHGGELRRR